MKLIALRKEKGWTQGELAYHAKLKRPYISLLEEGRIKKPSAEKLILVAKAFKIDPNDLFSAAGYTAISRRNSQFSSALRVCIPKLAQLPHESQDTIARMLEPLLEHMDNDLAKSTTGNDGSGTDGGTPTRQIIPSAILNAVFQSRLHRTPVAYSG